MPLGRPAQDYRPSKEKGGRFKSPDDPPLSLYLSPPHPPIVSRADRVTIPSNPKLVRIVKQPPMNNRNHRTAGVQGGSTEARSAVETHKEPRKIQPQETKVPLENRAGATSQPQARSSSRNHTKFPSQGTQTGNKQAHSPENPLDRDKGKFYEFIRTRSM